MAITGFGTPKSSLNLDPGIVPQPSSEDLRDS
jgi:hypothetical protein